MLSLRERLFLLIIAGFLILGNLPRFLPMPTAFGNVNLSEVLLYAISLLIFPIRSFSIFRTSLGVTLILGTVFSTCVGLLKWGIDFTALVYSSRLLIQITIAHLVAGILAEKLYSPQNLIVRNYLLTYTAMAAIAIALLILFPNSTDLWKTLSSFGVEFAGDPHINRLVSLYFDPNFYATIIVLPTIIALHGALSEKKLSYIASSALLILTLFLTVSRSGISLLFLIAIGYAILQSPRLHLIKLPQIILPAVPLLIFSLSTATLLSFEQVERLAMRLAQGLGDGSSTARFESFSLGLRLMEDEFLFGYGYNFALSFIRESGRNGIDSSLQLFFLTYGALPATIILIIFAIKFYIIDRNLRQISNTPTLPSLTSAHVLWRIVASYFVMTLLWAAHFNQVLFYPFWLIPTLAFIFLFERVSDNHVRQCQRTDLF